MSLLELMLLLVAIAAGGLYFFTKQTVRDQKSYIEKLKIQKNDFSDEADKFCEELTSKNKEIEILSQAIEEHGNDFRELQSLYNNAKEEIRELFGRINEATQNDPRAIQLLLQNYDHRFVNSATINVNSITLKDIELIHEDHIKVIRSLAAKGYFRQDLAFRFNYNPKTGTVDFNLIEFDDDTPIDTLPWSAFLLQRTVFIQTITEYIEGVIGQREINKAVEEAIEGSKEVTNA
jgi:hypothetical protein